MDFIAAGNPERLRGTLLSKRLKFAAALARRLGSRFCGHFDVFGLAHGSSDPARSYFEPEKRSRITLMTFKYLRTALMGAVCLWSASAVAVTIDIDFEGDTPGAQPLVDSTPDDPMNVPTAIGGYTLTTADNPPTAANGTLVVGSAPGMAQGAIMTANPANGVLGSLWIDNNGVNLIGQQIRMSFDVNILDAPTTATVQPKTLNGGTAGILLGMNTFLTSPGGGIGPRFAAAPTSASGGVFAFRTPDNSELIDFFNYTEGQTYNVAFKADYTTGTLDAFVDGVELLSDYVFLPGGASNVNTGECFFHLNGELGNANSVALDNIRAAAVPEPASIMLLGLAGSTLGLFAVRRRSRG
jgi:PEP-CTERM motif